MAGIRELPDEALDEVAGGKDNPACKSTYQDYENCWYDDGCDNIFQIYDEYICHRGFFTDHCHETAGMAEDIRRMPMGMNTLISEGQGGISGGQRQRLMIARAVAPKPKILMFDEATSALDNLTQKQVAEALDKMKCTRIVIAHRLSTIRQCDRIIVLDSGHIIEDGTYEELIEKNGYFAELVARQRLDTPA